MISLMSSFSLPNSMLQESIASSETSCGSVSSKSLNSESELRGLSRFEVVLWREFSTADAGGGEWSLRFRFTEFYEIQIQIEMKGCGKRPAPFGAAVKSLQKIHFITVLRHLHPVLPSLDSSLELNTTTSTAAPDWLLRSSEAGLDEGASGGGAFARREAASMILAMSAGESTCRSATRASGRICLTSGGGVGPGAGVWPRNWISSSSLVRSTTLLVVLMGSVDLLRDEVDPEVEPDRAAGIRV